MDGDREAFRHLWTIWKAGKGEPETDEDKRRLLATARLLLMESWWQRLLRVCREAIHIGAPPRHCQASLRYLRRVRADVFRRVQHDAEQPEADPVVLHRGIRGGRRAEAFRSDSTPETMRLTSYSTRESGGITFASLGNDKKKDGIRYKCSVPLAEIVFFEDASLCNEYPDEYEVLVLHSVSPGDVSVLETHVRPRAKIRFGKKP